MKDPTTYLICGQRLFVSLAPHPWSRWSAKANPCDPATLSRDGHCHPPELILSGLDCYNIRSTGLCPTSWPSVGSQGDLFKYKPDAATSQLNTLHGFPLPTSPSGPSVARSLTGPPSLTQPSTPTSRSVRLQMFISPNCVVLILPANLLQAVPPAWNARSLFHLDKLPAQAGSPVQVISVLWRHPTLATLCAHTALLGPPLDC